MLGAATDHEQLRLGPLDALAPALGTSPTDDGDVRLWTNTVFHSFDLLFDANQLVIHLLEINAVPEAIKYRSTMENPSVSCICRWPSILLREWPLLKSSGAKCRCDSLVGALIVRGWPESQVQQHQIDIDPDRLRSCALSTHELGWG